jgi:hypothetical protein
MRRRLVKANTEDEEMEEIKGPTEAEVRAISPR